jgi:hypothetical protein
MDDRKKTKTAIIIIIFFGVILIVTFLMLFTRNQIISPVPEDSVIKIIFITPTSKPSSTNMIIPTLTINPTKP